MWTERACNINHGHLQSRSFLFPGRFNFPLQFQVCPSDVTIDKKCQVGRVHLTFEVATVNLDEVMVALLRALRQKKNRFISSKPWKVLQLTLQCHATNSYCDTHDRQRWTGKELEIIRFVFCIDQSVRFELEQNECYPSFKSPFIWILKLWELFINKNIPSISRGKLLSAVRLAWSKQLQLVCLNQDVSELYSTFGSPLRSFDLFPCKIILSRMQIFCHKDVRFHEISRPTLLHTCLVVPGYHDGQPNSRLEVFYYNLSWLLFIYFFVGSNWLMW